MTNLSQQLKDKKKEKADRCECGGKIALCTAYVYSATMDIEPFIDGVKEGNEEELCFENPIDVIVHVCVKCRKVKDGELEI